MGKGQSSTSEPNQLVREVVAQLADQHPEFVDFWAKTKEQQAELIERYGTPSDRELWRKRNERQWILDRINGAAGTDNHQ